MFLFGILNRGVNSSTLMTWANLSTRIISTVIVLPLLLQRLDHAEISLWFLFSTLMIIQTFADIGFNDTFIRVISFGYGGAHKDKLYDLRTVSRKDGVANWQTIEAVWSTTSWIYNRLSVVVLLLFILAGPLSLKNNINNLLSPSEGWLAYALLVIGSTIQFYGGRYNIYLQGVNHVALVNRWGALTSLCGILTSFLALYLFGSLLSLVVANQGWNIINVLRNYFLARHVENGRMKFFGPSYRDRHVFDAVWPSAWRSGVGVIMSNVVVNASGLIYAQIGEPKAVASYLLGFRLIQTVVSFSLAPFYSKLPYMARLRAEGRLDEQVDTARRGMQFSYWVYVTGFISIGVLATPLLKLIKSNADFVSPLLWSLMGMAFLIERFGAMHIQLYSTTNHIIWHKANGITGAIYLLLSFGLIQIIGVYSFPVALIIGHLSFYAWYSAKHSYSIMDTTFLKFESKVLFAPALLMCLGIMVINLWAW